MKRKGLAILLVLAMLFAGCAGKETELKVKKPKLPEVQESSETEVTIGDGEKMDMPKTSRVKLLEGVENLSTEEIVPNLPPIEIAPDFSNVYDPRGELEWKPEGVKAMLLQNGFAVLDSGGSEFFEEYEMNRYMERANFVTTDSMLHTYHLYFAYLLENLESTSLSERLLTLSRQMKEESLAQLTTLKGTEWEKAAKRNVAFFTIGAKLLDENEEIPGDVKDVVEAELNLIATAGEIKNSPLMDEGNGTMEDYSQYKPRGYYAESEELSRYFRAMMWYGRIPFLASEEEHTKSAVLMSVALCEEEIQKNWSEIYAVTSFFAGDSDDPTCFEYMDAIGQAYNGVPDIAALPKQEKEWKSFQSLLENMRKGEINSVVISETDDRDEKVQGLRFMGQRFSLDAAIFQNLVYRNVLENSAGEKRMLPDALDIPAAMGSERALAILTEQGETDYKDYSENMDKIRAGIAELPEDTWQRNLYNGWLGMLRPLTVEKTQGWPTFMQNEAWTTKNLNTFLGSFTELKHDTVLYTKQMYAEMGGGDMEEVDDRGYVEPEPKVFGALAGLCQATSEGLDKFGMLSEADKNNLALLAELSKQLTTISEKELKNEDRTEEEYELIRSYGGQLEHFWTEVYKDKAEKAGDILTPQFFPSAIVVDIATDPNGSVLEVATGDVNTIYVMVEVDGKLKLASGSVYSFYQFEQPLSERLTDTEWRQMLGIVEMDFDNPPADYGEVEKPQRPAWTDTFVTSWDY